MSLEAERKKAEETLTLLAAADAAKKELEGDKATALSEADKRAAELAQANALLAEQKDISAEGQRQVALLNQQTASLREQLNSLQGLLDASEAKDVATQVQIENLGANLNAALAQVAVEQKRRADLEEKEKERLQAEAHNLESYRSEFFGQMRAILGDREGVQVVGDRFVFPSEVLFAPGSATLGAEGQEQVARVAQVIREIADQIPPEINWILRVDGHTDKTPVTPGGPFRDNWELSEARALSVVRYMSQVAGPAAGSAGRDRLRGVPADRPGRQPGGAGEEPADRAQVHRTVAAARVPGREGGSSCERAMVPSAPRGLLWPRRGGRLSSSFGWLLVCTVTSMSSSSNQT